MRAIAATPGKHLSHWVWHLSRDLGGLRQRLLDRLVARDTLEKHEKRVLLLFHQRTCTPNATRGSSTTSALG